MAILGFHLVVTLIVITIISKIGSRLSLIQLYITRGLYRFVAPNNQELRALLPSSKEKANPRVRRKKREEEDTQGFNVPKSLPLQLRRVEVQQLDLQQFPLYTSIHWLSIFVPLCLLVYVLSESFLALFPYNGDINVSIIWLLIAVAFVLQVLATLTAWIIVNEDERSILFCFALIFFLISCLFTMWSDKLFDLNLLAAYDQFSANVAALMLETGATQELDTKLKSPLLLYISMSIFFSFLAAMLVFPNFRLAAMYTRALEAAGPLTKFMLHLTFLAPILALILFANPIKHQIVHGPRKLVTEEQYDIIRVYVVIVSLLLRFWMRRPHLQAHLDTAHEKVQLLQKQTGYIRNVDLQNLILRYYSYFCAAVMQYFAPVLLTTFFALLLKSTGGLSWIGSPISSPVESSTVALSTIRAIFDTTVCRAFWSFSLVFTTFINFSLSMIGVVYNSYFIQA